MNGFLARLLMPADAMSERVSRIVVTNSSFRSGSVYLEMIE